MPLERVSQGFRDISMTFQNNPLNSDLIVLKNETAIARSIRNIVFTLPGEKFFNPNFGSGVRQLLFENVADLTSLEEQLAEGINRNVQNIRVYSVIATQQNNSIYINIDYSINNINDQLTVEITSNE